MYLLFQNIVASFKDFCLLMAVPKRKESKHTICHAMFRVRVPRASTVKPFGTFNVGPRNLK
jgi:hypothetical protein